MAPATSCPPVHQAAACFARFPSDDPEALATELLPTGRSHGGHCNGSSGGGGNGDCNGGGAGNAARARQLKTQLRQQEAGVLVGSTCWPHFFVNRNHLRILFCHSLEAIIKSIFDFTIQHHMCKNVLL